MIVEKQGIKRNREKLVQCRQTSAYLSDVWLDGQYAQWVTPPAGQTGPGAGVVQAGGVQA